MRSLWSLPLSMALMAIPVQAEFVCRSDVSYKWVKTPPKGQKSGQPEADGASETAPETTVRFVTVERKGRDEAAAKAAILPDLNRAKARASDACSREHENFAACVATKFEIQSSTLAAMSFNARRELERAVASDCQSRAGTCVTAASSDLVCEELKAVEQPTLAAPEAASGKKKK